MQMSTNRHAMRPSAQPPCAMKLTTWPPAPSSPATPRASATRWPPTRPRAAPRRTWRRSGGCSSASRRARRSLPPRIRCPAPRLRSRPRSRRSPRRSPPRPRRCRPPPQRSPDPPSPRAASRAEAASAGAPSAGRRRARRTLWTGSSMFAGGRVRHRLLRRCSRAAELPMSKPAGRCTNHRRSGRRRKRRRRSSGRVSTPPSSLASSVPDNGSRLLTRRHLQLGPLRWLPWIGGRPAPVGSVAPRCMTYPSPRARISRCAVGTR
mmetsp:Transcript_35703/g.115786  ORF Transcript_35703/g.115786 Transcript_35703/m.115786 type:complete len:264 (+) Transcript_35703:1345-2136(+)